MCSLIGLPIASFLCLDSRIIHFGEFFSSEVEIPSRLNSDFTIDPHSQHIVAILIL